MITAQEARASMPTSSRMNKEEILESLSTIIKKAASEDLDYVEIPHGLFTDEDMKNVIYNATYSPTFKSVVEELLAIGFKFKRRVEAEKIIISW